MQALLRQLCFACLTGIVWCHQKSYVLASILQSCSCRSAGEQRGGRAK
jgi:hypothetical protein